MTRDWRDAPAYCSKDAEINRPAAASLNGLPRPSPQSAAEICKLAAQGYVILDVRSAGEFGAGHVPVALNIGLGGQFASWAGSLIPMTSPIVIVADSEAQVDEAQVRLARVGLENVKGYLAGGMNAWQEAGLELAIVPQISVTELRGLIETRPDLQLVDIPPPPHDQ